MTRTKLQHFVYGPLPIQFNLQVYRRRHEKTSYVSNYVFITLLHVYRATAHRVSLKVNRIEFIASKI